MCLRNIVWNVVQGAQIEARNFALREAASLANPGKVSAPFWMSVSTSEIGWAGGAICGSWDPYHLWGTLLRLPCSALETTCQRWPGPFPAWWPLSGVKRGHSAQGQKDEGEQRIKKGRPLTRHCLHLICVALFLTQWIKGTSQWENRSRGNWRDIFILTITKRL